MSSPLRSDPLLKPAPVEHGAAISIVSPASYALPERMERGVERLIQLGYDPRPEVNAQTPGPLFFAGTVEQRLTDLHSAFTDRDTTLIACVRGGYGSNYLLDGLDLELIRKNPKPLFAYSDLTGIQLHLLDRLGLPVFHGPMVAADFYLDDGVHESSFQAAISGQPYSVGVAEGMRVLKPGKASGTLYGGCLSILVAMLGTPWEPSTEGRLLFLEDVGAKPYQIDRMLWQLRHAGKLAGVRGVILGEMLDCTAPGASPELLEKIVLHAFHDFDIPVVMGLRSGHVSRQNVTLTFGVRAELLADADSEVTLNILEPAVKP